jgi:hypothetical protein
VRWEWIGREAVLHFDNPHARPMTVRVELDARAFGARELRLRPAADEAGGAPVRLGVERTKVSFGPIELPVGRSRWVLRSTEPAVRAGPGDPRLIAVCVYGVTVEAAATHPAP